jgi:hypothetical protein
MKNPKLIFALILVLGLSSSSLAQEAKRTATIIELKGKVEVSISKGPWQAAKPDMVLNQGDVIRTKANSSVLLNVDGSAETATVEIKQNSQLRLLELLANEKERSQKTLLDLALGEILIKAKKLHSEKSSFEVKTPTSIIGVRGTTFSVTVEAVE